MKVNTSWARKLLTAASSLALGISGVVGVTSPAHATDLPPIEQVTTTFEDGDTSYSLSGFCTTDWTAYAADDSHHVSGVDWLPPDPNFKVGAPTSTGHNGNVLKVIKLESAPPWAGINVMNQSTGTIISTDHLTVTADVWAADANVPVQMKLTNAAGDAGIFAIATTGAAGWSSLTFDFSNPSAGYFDNGGYKVYTYDASIAYSKMVLVFDPANDIAGHGHDNWWSCGDLPTTDLATTSKLYNIDNIAFDLQPLSFPTYDPWVQDFEPTTDYATYGLKNDFGCDPRQSDNECAAGDQVSTLVERVPFTDGHALKIVRGGLPWAGTTFTKTKGNLNLISISNTTVTADIWAPAAGKKIMMKVENALNTKSVKVDATETTVVGWHTYTFDFTANLDDGSSSFDSSVVYEKATIFMNFGATGSGAGETGSVWYLDDVTFQPEPLTPLVRTSPATLITFEDGDTSTGGIKGAFGGVSAAIVNAPAGGNGGKALMLTKPAVGAETWGGTTILNSSEGSTKWTTSDHPTIGMSFYSSREGMLSLNVELTVDVQSVVDVPVVPGWQHLTFDMSTAANYAGDDIDYVKVSVFPMRGLNGTAGAGTFYIDDVTLNGQVSPNYGAAPVISTSASKKSSVTGTAKSGKKLTAKAGTWTGRATIGKTYQWYACDAAKLGSASVPSGCTAINGATGSTFTLTAAQKSSYVSVKVTATNLAGTASYFAKTTSKVK